MGMLKINPYISTYFDFLRFGGVGGYRSWGISKWSCHRHCCHCALGAFAEKVYLIYEQ